MAWPLHPGSVPDSAARELRSSIAVAEVRLRALAGNSRRAAFDRKASWKPHSRRLTALAVVGGASHLAFFGIAAVHVCMQLEAERAPLSAAFVLLCAAAVAARGRLLWCRCCHEDALRELDLLPAPRPWALHAMGCDHDDDAADAVNPNPYPSPNPYPNPDP